MVFVWPAFAIAVAGIVAGIVIAIVRGLRTWRDFKRFGGTMGTQVGQLETAAAEIETHLSRAAEASDRLSVALESLQRSRAQLEVLLAAVKEARTSVERAVPFLGSQ